MNLPKKNDDGKGLIFNIQRFSIHDGPGIRSTVFMKGCPLNCHWCSNPESRDFFPNLMVSDMHCRQCGACEKICPQGAITLTPEAGRKIAWGKCNHCLACVDACIYNALNSCGKYMHLEEILDEVLKDKAFYRNSGGGMTISGGEALSQWEFVGHLLGEGKRLGLHTALDTSGYAPWETMEKVLPPVDLILWDIKHLNPREHKKITGVENQIILENITNASKTKPLWLRMPLIAGVNDSDTHLAKLIDLAQAVAAEKISLLPYHEGGKSKCEQLGRPYPFPEGRAPSDERIESIKAMIEKQGINLSIGS
jgi:pyruvate formate lyase activating enzyme